MVKVHQIQNPIGVDRPIGIMQDHLVSKLNWENIEIYGRTYPVKDGPAKLPKAYTGNGEYAKDVFTLELGNNKVFFLANGPAKVLPGGMAEETIKVVFMVDLKTIFPTLTHRADAEAIQLAQELVSGVGFFNNIVEVQTQIEDIMKGYDLSHAGLLNIQPRCMFSINSKVKYYFNNYCLKC